MKLLVAAFVAAFALAGPVRAQEPQDSAYVSTSRALADFDTISVSGAIKVFVLVGSSTAEITLTGPPVMMDDTVAEVENGVLSIHFHEDAPHSWNIGAGMNVLVRIPALAAAQLEGPGELTISEVTGEGFAAATEGAGSIILQNVDVDEVQFVTGGAGGIRAEGVARHAAIATNGSGSIAAKRLRVANADIAVVGSGSVFADVSDLANVLVQGSGSADIVGGAECNVQDNGSGRIECR